MKGYPVRPLRRTYLLISVGVLAQNGLGSMALAQDDAKSQEIISIYDKAAKDAGLFDFSLGSPTVPFLPLADIGPDEIPVVETPRRFGLAVANAFAGKSAEGASIEFAPLAVTNPALSLYRYNQLDWISRIYARSKVGAAFTPGVRANDDGTGAKASGITLSLSTKFFDASDRALSDRGAGTVLERCLSNPAYAALLLRRSDAITAANSQALLQMKEKNIDSNTAAGDAITKQVYKTARVDELFINDLKAQFGECEKQVEVAFRNRPALDGGVGLRWQGDAGELKGLHKAGAMIWSTLTSGDLLGNNNRSETSLFDLHAQVAVHGRYVFDDAFTSVAGEHLGSSHSLFLAGAIQSLPAKDGEERFLWSAQVAWNKQNAPPSVPAGTLSKDYVRYSGLAGLKLTKGLWVKFAAGRATGRGIENDNFLSIGLSFSPVKNSETVSKALDSLIR